MFFSFFLPPRLLSLCWIVLFDLECSERRALCNISSTHMAVCVTAKHMGGEVAMVAAVALWREEEGRGRRGRRKEVEVGSVDGCEGRNAAPRVGVGSFSLLRLLSRATVTWAPNKPHNET